MITPVGMQESALTISSKKHSSNDAEITTEFAKVEQLVDTKEEEGSNKLDSNNEINISIKENVQEEEKEPGVETLEVIQ